MHIVMEEKMNEEQSMEDGQREEDDIDYVEDREELTEERIKDMLDAREYKELKEELETNMYPVDLAEILEKQKQLWGLANKILMKLSTIQ